MYSSIMKTNSRPGDWIAILGAGGGLGHMYDHFFIKPDCSIPVLIFNVTRGVQIAAKKGLRVLAIDRYAPLWQ